MIYMLVVKVLYNYKKRYELALTRITHNISVH